uniref:Uncharacterized protein n=1 Tax=Triticum urartu TaxID=4572 RepID=A0A8R7PKB4_TRIUA
AAQPQIPKSSLTASRLWDQSARLSSADRGGGPDPVPSWVSTASGGAVPALGRLDAVGAAPAGLALFQAALEGTLLRHSEVDLAPYFFLPQSAILHSCPLLMCG